jgi:hypothetical protein
VHCIPYMLIGTCANQNYVEYFYVHMDMMCNPNWKAIWFLKEIWNSNKVPGKCDGTLNSQRLFKDLWEILKNLQEMLRKWEITLTSHWLMKELWGFLNVS